MAFCEQCGIQLDDEAKFCTNCGTPRSAVEILKTPLPAYVPQNNIQQMIADDRVLWSYTIDSRSFYYKDFNGKTISANKAFQVGGSAIVKTLLIGTDAFVIKVEVYNNKICFTRLKMLVKPTDQVIEINGSEIVLVEREDTFLKKSITIFTRSRGRFNFPVNKNMGDDIAGKLYEMANRNRD